MPCVLVVSSRVDSTGVCVPSGAIQVLVTRREARCPVFTTTATPVCADQRRAWARASSSVSAGPSPVSTASSWMLGVTTVARRQNWTMACSASGSSSRSPLVATMTGSTTSTGGWCSSSQASTAVMVSTVPSIPVLTASRVTSSLTARSWSVRKSVGGVWMERTPWVFWATRAVTALIP